MNSTYLNTIDTDMGIGTILSNFNTNYINHVIDDSLNMKFRPFDGPMPNFVDILERQFNAILINTHDYQEKVNEVRVETYKEIILKICTFYNISFVYDFDSLSMQELYGIAHTMYDIFISRFTEFMFNFFVSYIVNNSNSIFQYLKNDENAIKPKETGAYAPKHFIDSKYILIHANVNKVIYNMAGYDISLHTLLNYFLDANSAARLGSMLVDNGDIYKYHYASYILDQRYTANIMTNIKLKLQSRTQEAINLIG